MSMSHKLFKIQKAFTLVEIMIVLVIVGSLMTILFRSYTEISKIYIKSQNEKTVVSEYKSLNAYLQNIIDQNKIDFEIWTGASLEDLKSRWFIWFQNGWTDTVHFVGKDDIRLYKTWDCVDWTWNYSIFSQNILNKKCRIEIENSGQIVKLTNPNTVYVSNVFFKISPDKYYTGDMMQYFEHNTKNWSDWVGSVYDPSIGIWAHIQVANYNASWVSSSNMAIQHVYN